jgi:hypothetical protein
MSKLGIIFSKVYLVFCVCPEARLEFYHVPSIIHGMDMGCDCILGIGVISDDISLISLRTWLVSVAALLRRYSPPPHPLLRLLTVKDNWERLERAFLTGHLLAVRGKTFLAWRNKGMFF